MELEHTDDIDEALEWAYKLGGPGAPAAFLLAPARFAFAERSGESFALTLHGQEWFGAGFGPSPPLRNEWQTCFISYSTLGDRVGRLVRGDEWDFYTRELVDVRTGGSVNEVTGAVAISALLSEHAPHSQVWPGDPEVVAWYGVDDEEGLASVAALVRWESGLHVVSSVATRSNARGRGLAERVLVGLMHAAAARGVVWLGLGVAHDNLVAERLYERTGFTRRAEFSAYRSPDVGSATT
ncbi:MAG TPA: GNAT family N-acetyltransferase [Acidimicrobiales bacterium]|nr:GNAT family N-acetyltransferase [Acidimicrobiales bacterium]